MCHFHLFSQLMSHRFNLESGLESEGKIKEDLLINTVLDIGSQENFFVLF